MIKTKLVGKPTKIMKHLVRTRHVDFGLSVKPNKTVRS